MNRYTAGIIVVLGLLLAAAGARIQALDRALAAKPKVEFREKVVEKKVTVKVAGPVRIEERIVDVPGGERVIERVIFKEAVKTETDADKAVSVAKKEEPACPAAAASKRWLVGAGFSPLAVDPLDRVRNVHGGITLFDRVDLVGGWEFSGHDRIRADVNMRF